MRSKITLTQEAADLFNNMGTIAEVNGKRYFYFPFWLKQTKNNLEFEVLSYDSLPSELTEDIKKMRENPNTFHHVSPFPASGDESEHNVFEEDQDAIFDKTNNAPYFSMERDDLFNEAAVLIFEHDCGSISLLQRKLRLGYHKAGKIMSQLENYKIVGPFQGSKAREIIFKDLKRLKDYIENLR